jgi:hypothetical protein
VTSQRIIELQRQKEIVEHWLDTPGIPADAHAKLIEMLGEVNEEINSVVNSPNTFDSARRRAS